MTDSNDLSFSYFLQIREPMELMAIRSTALKLASILSISFGLCTQGEFAARGTTAEFLNCLNQIEIVRIMIEM